MCVICVKPKGVEFPSDERIGQMFDANDDGSGFMYVKDGMVEIRKGFMKAKTFRKAIRREGLTKDHTVIMHFRIGTTGSNTPKNTHPFPVTDKLAELRATSITTDVGMAHNGILAYGGDKENDLSDTMAFVREVLSHPPIKNSLFDLPTFTLIESAIGSSKMVFLNGTGTFVLLGDWKEATPKDGCYYSNLNFERSYTTTGYWKSDNHYTSRYPLYGYIECSDGVWRAEDKAKEFEEAKANPTKGQLILLPSKEEAQAKKDWDAMDEEEWKTERALRDMEEREKDFKKGDWANAVFVDYDDRECPQCKYPIESINRINCSKCGVFFYRPHEAEYYGGY
jgi:hypothetical protein